MLPDPAQDPHMRWGKTWLQRALADNPVGLWVPGVNDSGSTLRSVSPGWAEKVRRSGPVAWWRLNTDGSDELGGHDGTVSGSPAAATGALGDDPDGALDFNGSTDYITVPYSADLNTAAFTVSAWIKRDVDTGAVEVIYDSRVANKGFDIRITAADAIQFGIETGGGRLGSTGTTVTTTGVWYHFSASYDGTTSRLYVNGVLEDSDVMSLALNDSGDTKIGSIYYGGLYFSGKIDELVYHDRALTADEIADLYLAGKSTHIATENGTVVRGVAGPFGVARDYDGSTGYLSVPYARGLNPASAFTIEAWVNLDVQAGAAYHVFDSRSSAGVGYRLGVNVSSIAPGKMEFDVGGLYTSDPTDCTLGSWIHYAAKYDGTTAYLYRNGVLVDSDARTLSANTTTGIKLSSRSFSTDTNFWNGKIGGVAIYRTALSATQIRDHYNAGFRS